MFIFWKDSPNSIQLRSANLAHGWRSMLKMRSLDTQPRVLRVGKPLWESPGRSGQVLQAHLPYWLALQAEQTSQGPAFQASRPVPRFSQADTDPPFSGPICSLSLGSASSTLLRHPASSPLDAKVVPNGRKCCSLSSFPSRCCLRHWRTVIYSCVLIPRPEVHRIRLWTNGHPSFMTHCC